MGKLVCPCLVREKTTGNGVPLPMPPGFETGSSNQQPATSSMNLLESKWLGERLASISTEDLSPLLNVGSSTQDFRTRQQPYIDQNIFAPLRKRGGTVYHADIKAAPGVDLVGDLLDPAFLAELSKLQIRSAMISNLFEHVTIRQQICDVLMKILPPGGYIFVSGPHRYPYHADPIDTMFRPSIEEMHGHFPGTRIIDSA